MALEMPGSFKHGRSNRRPGDCLHKQTSVIFNNGKIRPLRIYRFVENLAVHVSSVNEIFSIVVLDVAGKIR